MAKHTLPPILYGTAWKKEHTQRLVMEALTVGFEGIDTANQLKHYVEEDVGFALQAFLKTSQKTRHDLFLQTKFTSLHGQDDRLPYNPSDSLMAQVNQSFVSSLNHLQTDYLDAYILHGPALSQGIIDADLEIWQAMEALLREGKVRSLGISNVNLIQLETLFNTASIKPVFVQNRCYSITQWDQDVRHFCQKNKLVYQGFSLLTANQHALSNPYIQSLAIKYHKTIPQLIFRFAIQIGMLPLTGTTNMRHMKNDLDIQDFKLTTEECLAIEQIGVKSKRE
jgi:diketogulonate reductase-like aldo/keto reductase